MNTFQHNLYILPFISTCGLMIFASIFGIYGARCFDHGPEQIGMIMVLGLVSALTQGYIANH